MFKIYDCQTGDQLDGTIHAGLVEASLAARHDGAVAALCDQGEWEFVAEGDVAQMRQMGWAVRTVWVEA